MNKNKTNKSRAFGFVLYPQEDQTHYTAMYRIMQFYQYALIEHTSDTYEDDTEEHIKGDIKKSHIHVVIKFDNPRSIEKIAKETGLAVNYIQKANFVAYTRYLIHKDDPMKHQYREEEISTNIPLEVHSALSLKSNYQRQSTNVILQFIQKNKFINFYQLVMWAKENRTIRRSSKKCIFLQKSSNEVIKKIKRKEKMSIRDYTNERNKKRYLVEIETKKIQEIKQISQETYKKFKNNAKISKISLHIEIEYQENTNGE